MLLVDRTIGSPGSTPDMLSTPFISMNNSGGPGPTIRQVQAAVVVLREASLATVQAVQEWRASAHLIESGTAGARESETASSNDGLPVVNRPGSTFGSSSAPIEENSRGDYLDSLSQGSFARDHHKVQQVNWPCSGTSFLRKTAENADASGAAGGHRLPAVSPSSAPAAVRANTASAQLGGGSDGGGRGRDIDGRDTLPHNTTATSWPTFWWVPPSCTFPSVSTTLSSPGKDLHNRETLRSLPGNRNNNGVDNNHVNDDKDTDRSFAEIVSPGTCMEPTQRLNYLAKMASDTDFAGEFGSALVDVFPPDTKLFRNPFLLGHNLDDTLAVVANDTAAAHKSAPAARTSLREGEILGKEASVVGDGDSDGRGQPGTRRIDTALIRLATTIIVAEDAKEKALKSYTTRPSSGLTGGRGEDGSDEPHGRLYRKEDTRYSSRDESGGGSRGGDVGGAKDDTSPSGSPESRKQLRQESDQLTEEDAADPENGRPTLVRSASSAGKKGRKKQKKTKPGGTRGHVEQGGGGNGEEWPEVEVPALNMIGVRDDHGTDENDRFLYGECTEHTKRRFAAITCPLPKLCGVITD